MPAPLAQLKQAAQQLSHLIENIPDLDVSLDHQLLTSFALLPADSCIHDLSITYEAPPEPGQASRLISYSLGALIEQSYLSGHVPTHEQSSTKVYNRAFSLDELDAVQNISVTQIEAFVSYVINNLELCVENTLEHFWKTPHISLENTKPQEWLSMCVRTLITAEAALRHSDKTLSDTGYAAVNQLLTHPTFQARLEGETRNPMHAYTVALKSKNSELDIPLYGLRVIAGSTAAQLGDTMTFNLAPEPPVVQDTQALLASRVVLYTPYSGLEDFDSLAALSRELQARLNDKYQREALLDCVLLKDRQRALSLSEVGYRETHTHVFNTYAAELIDQQTRNLSHAWETARAQHTQYNLEKLASLIEPSLLINLNPTGIVQARYTRLLESQLPAWLTTASEPNKQQWRQAVERLKHERLVSLTAPNAEHAKNSTLLDYAKAQLKQHIRTDHQLEINPDQIFVSITHAHSTGPGLYPLSTSGYAAGVSVPRTGPAISHSNTRRSLSELALANVGLLDVTFAMTARVQDPHGKNHPILTPAYLKALVRRLDIGKNYNTLLYKTLIDPNSAQVKWRKERYSAVTTAQLHLDVVEAKLAGHLTDEEARWVQAALSQPVESARLAVNGKLTKVHLLALRGQAMPGIFVFSTQPSSQLICYTPNAPDNLLFRKAESLADLTRELSKKTLHRYVVQRTTTATQPYIKHSQKQGQTLSHMRLEDVATDFLQALYHQEAMFAVHNADEQSTSTYEANVQTAIEVAVLLVDVISIVLPTKILLPLTFARFAYNLLGGLDALQRDDKDEALTYFYESVSHLSDATSDFASSAVFKRTIRQRIQMPVPTLNPLIANTRSRADLVLRDSDRYGSGIYEYTQAGNQQPLYYLQGDKGNMYPGHYDNLNEMWRVVDERQPESFYSTPVSQVGAGRWSTSSATPASSMSVHELIERAAVNIDLSTQAPNANGIYQTHFLSYIQQNGIVFEVRHGWLGRHLYLNIPGSSRRQHNIYKVRRNYEQGYWEVKRRLSDNSKQWEPLTLNQPRRVSLTPDTPTVVYSQYAAAPEHLNVLRELTVLGDINLTGYIYRHNVKWEVARRHAAKLQQKMIADALTFFNDLPPISRPKQPYIHPNAAQEVIFRTLYDNYSGVIVAETHFAESGKKILLDNMAYLAENNVKVLYMEHLQADLHQAYLDQFYKTGAMHPELELFLKSQDYGHKTNISSGYTFSRLIQETQRHGIQVKALDCFVSYYTRGLVTPQAKSVRHELFSYGSSQIIRNTTPQTGPQKWIALTGNSHANTFKGVPGLAELENAVALRVQDVLPGTGQGIKPDTGFIEHSPLRTHRFAFLKNDWVLDIEIPGASPFPAPLTREQLATMLHTPGMYTFENQSPHGPLIIHHARTGELVETPFFFDSTGAFHIKRAIWQNIHQKPYIDLNHLIADLADLQMKRAQ